MRDCPAGRLGMRQQGEYKEMPKALWNGAVIAEAPRERCQSVEGNTYFPPDSVDRQYLRESATHTVCAWKGTASYYDLAVGGQVNPDAAWFYPEPTDAARNIRDHVAFWKGVEVQD